MTPKPTLVVGVIGGVLEGSLPRFRSRRKGYRNSTGAIL